MEIHRKKLLKLLTLLLSSALIATVSATAYVTLQWTTTTTIEANPNVSFVDWSNGNKANTFTYSVNIFPSIKTVDQNISYGIWNSHGSDESCHMKLATTNTNDTDITSINVTIWTTGSTAFTHKWTDLTDNTWYDFTASANTKYAIWIEIECSSGAVVGHTPQFTFEMKVDNP